MIEHAKVFIILAILPCISLSMHNPQLTVGNYANPEDYLAFIKQNHHIPTSNGCNNLYILEELIIRTIEELSSQKPPFTASNILQIKTNLQVSFWNSIQQNNLETKEEYDDFFNNLIKAINNSNSKEAVNALVENKRIITSIITNLKSESKNKFKEEFNTLQNQATSYIKKIIKPLFQEAKEQSQRNKFALQIHLLDENDTDLTAFQDEQLIKYQEKLQEQEIILAQKNKILETLCKQETSSIQEKIDSINQIITSFINFNDEYSNILRNEALPYFLDFAAERAARNSFQQAIEQFPYNSLTISDVITKKIIELLNADLSSEELASLTKCALEIEDTYIFSQEIKITIELLLKIITLEHEMQNKATDIYQNVTKFEKLHKQIETTDEEIHTKNPQIKESLTKLYNSILQKINLLLKQKSVFMLSNVTVETVHDMLLFINNEKIKSFSKYNITQFLQECNLLELWQNIEEKIKNKTINHGLLLPISTVLNYYYPFDFASIYNSIQQKKLSFSEQSVDINKLNQINRELKAICAEKIAMYTNLHKQTNRKDDKRKIEKWTNMQKNLNEAYISALAWFSHYQIKDTPTFAWPSSTKDMAKDSVERTSDLASMQESKTETTTEEAKEAAAKNFSDAQPTTKTADDAPKKRKVKLPPPPKHTREEELAAKTAKALQNQIEAIEN